MLFLIDRLLIKLIVPERALQKEIRTLSIRESIRPRSSIEEAFDYLDVIDTKAGALLTHISVFAAINGILLASQNEDTVYRVILVVELVSFLFLAFLCLRCLRILSPDKNERSKTLATKKILREMIYRRRIYNFVHEASGIITLILIATTFYRYIIL